MSEDWAYKPHIRIPTENIDKRPKKGRKPPPVPKKDQEEHSSNLENDYSSVIQHCKRENKITSEDCVLMVYTEKPVSLSESTFKRLNFNFSLQLSDTSVIVTVEDQHIKEFTDSIKIYRETNKLRSYFTNILTIKIADFNRISDKLLPWFHSEAKEDIEIELLPNLGLEKYNKIISGIQKYANENEIRINNSLIKETSSSLRINVSPQQMRTILDGMDSIWKVRQPPIIVKSRPQSITSPVEYTLSPPEEGSKNICILDTGIDSKHPLLNDLIIDQVDFTTDQNPMDFNGHGTFVSGIAAYGNLDTTGNYFASAKIISSKILGKEGTPFPYLETYIENAVSRYHRFAKIFNLSVMYPTYSNFDNPSELSHTIDTLSKKHDIVFVVCSGNIIDEFSQINVGNYPLYFSDNKCIVYCGAESSNSITVGGVANKESHDSIAKREHPSPFTRRGEFNTRAKPDVVSWAGNNIQLPNGLPSSTPNLNIISLGLSPNILAHDSGTSYSAPYVANILAKLQREFPDASANLLKAMVIHFSRWPDNHLLLNASANLKKTLFGKGIPEFNRCAFSTIYSTSYLVEDEIQLKEVSHVPFYVPAKMRDIYGEKIIRATLVFDPPTDRGVLGYNLVDLKFKLYKEYREQRKWDKRFRNKWDNVKTDIFRWQKGGWGKDWVLQIIPQTRFNNKLEEMGFVSQKYALIITLEDPSQKIDVYNSITNEKRLTVQPLEAYFQSSRIPIPRQDE